MRPGLFTDGLAHLSLGDAVAWCAERGITELELGVGGYSSAPHLPGDVVDDAASRRAFLAVLEQGGGRVSAFNASGNPLHPDPALAATHDAALRRGLRLAAALGVERVVAMSGCPGGPSGDGGWPVFAGGAWLPDMEGLWRWQWEERIAPYWRELSQWAAREAPGVVVCLELHPGTSIYNPASFDLLRSVAGELLRVNLDPSHFWWQGIEPEHVVRELGESISFAHGKDTLLNRRAIAGNGVLDFAWPERPPGELPWHFAAVGGGHELEEWSRLLAALREVGYDDVVSIEHEDPRLTPEEGIEASLAALEQAIRLSPASVQAE